jgi:hypothetical protein
MIAKKLDIIIGFMGLSVAVFIFIALILMHSGERYLFFSGALSSAFIFYIVFRKKMIDMPPDENLCLAPFNKAFFLSLNIAFIFLFTLSILLLRLGLYHRSLSYFIIITIICGIIAIGILISDKKEHAGLILLQIFLVSLNIRGGIYSIYPSLYGTDPWRHVAIIQSIVELAHIPPISECYSYAHLPIMHLDVVVTEIITSLNGKDLLFYSIGLITVFSTIFIFLLGQRVFNTKIGLLATLLLNTSNFHIYFGTWEVIPMTLGAVFFTMILYILANNREDTKRNLFWSSSPLSFLYIGILIFTHLAAFMVLVSVIFGYITNKFYFVLKRDETNSYEINISSSIVLFFIVAIIAHWMYASYATNFTFLEYVINTVHNSLISIGVGDVTITTITTGAISPIAAILGNLGYTIAASFAIIGALIALSHRNFNSSRLFIVTIFFVLFFLTFIPRFFGTGTFSMIMPGRWYLFQLIAGSLLASLAVFSVVRFNKTDLARTISIFIIISLIVFFMITSPPANPDSPIYSKELETTISAYTSSELAAADFVPKMGDNIKITTDYVYGHVIFMYLNRNYSEPINVLVLHDRTTYGRGITVIRQSVMDKGVIFRLGNTYYKEYFNKTIIKEFEAKNLIYSNGMVTAYES